MSCIISDMSTKACTKCGIEKPLDQYNRRGKGDARHAHCKACVSEISKRWYLNNLEREREKRRQYAAANADVGNERSRRWAKENPDRRNENCRRWRDGNRDRLHELDRLNRAANPERQKEKDRRRYAKDPQKERDRSRLYQSINVEKITESQRRYRDANREKVREASRRWARENPGLATAKVARRTARKMLATPAWSDIEAIKKIYENCPPGYHVDHFYPLRAKTVSGLHVPNNLQYLSAEENVRKRNQLPSEPEPNLTIPVGGDGIRRAGWQKRA